MMQTFLLASFIYWQERKTSNFAHGTMETISLQTRKCYVKLHSWKSSIYLVSKEDRCLASETNSGPGFHRFISLLNRNSKQERARINPIANNWQAVTIYENIQFETVLAISPSHSVSKLDLPLLHSRTDSNFHFALKTAKSPILRSLSSKRRYGVSVSTSK